MDKSDKFYITTNSIIGIINTGVGLITLDIAPSLIYAVLGSIFLMLGVFFLVKTLWRFFHPSSSPMTPITAPIPEAKAETGLDSDRDFLDQAFEKLYQTSALILLAQEHRITPPLLGKIDKHFKEHCGTENTYHLIPLASSRAEPATYFSHLGKQLGLFETIHNDAQLESALQKRLAENRLCLLISRLEKGDDARANEFAKVLRNLLETTKLRILLCGGQKLAELKFADGQNSLLNNARVEEWSELTVNDVQKLYRQHFSGPSLNTGEAYTLLAISGGHPILLQSCLEYRAENGNLTINDYLQRLKHESALTAIFGRFKKTNYSKQLCEWLAQSDVAPAEPYIFDELLRKVYWLNLLVKHNNRLMWRCEAVREAGQAILRCE